MLRVPPTSPSARAQAVPVVVAPAELWPSAQPSPGHHIARSTMIGTPLVDATVEDSATSASGKPGLAGDLLEVHPDVGARVRGRRQRPAEGAAVGQQVGDGDCGVLRVGIGDQQEQVEVGAGGAFGEEPIQRGGGDAHALVAGVEGGPGVERYMARSTMIGAPSSVSMTADTSVLARARPRPGTSSTLTQMLVREVGGRA